MFANGLFKRLAVHLSAMTCGALAGSEHHFGTARTRDTFHASNCTNRSYEKQCGKNWDYTSYPTDQQFRADAVVEMFRFAWDGYYKYVYPHDDLFPKNNSFSDSRNGWGLTMVDALDTAIIMEQKDIVEIILHWIPTVDVTKNNSPKPVSTSLFETTIRYIGGLLGAYDLLKGPFSNLGYEVSKVDALLTQAVNLADTVKFAFDTPSGLPKNSIYIDNQTFTDESRMQNGDYSAGLAEIGTLVLEWQRLSDLTGTTLVEKHAVMQYVHIPDTSQETQSTAHWHKKPSRTGSTHLRSGQVSLVATSALRLGKSSIAMAAGLRATTQRMSTSSRCMSMIQKDTGTIASNGKKSQTLPYRTC